MKTILLTLALGSIAFSSPAWSQSADQHYGAVVVYADPLEAGGPVGEAFSAPSEAQVVDIAVQSCKANTVKAQLRNCEVGRWIATGQILFSAHVCEALDDRGISHQILFFSKDGVTASDGQIEDQAQRRIIHGAVAEGGCRTIASYDKDKPARTEPEDSLIVRSVATDKSR